MLVGAPRKNTMGTSCSHSYNHASNDAFDVCNDLVSLMSLGQYLYNILTIDFVFLKFAQIFKTVKNKYVGEKNNFEKINPIQKWTRPILVGIYFFDFFFVQK